MYCDENQPHLQDKKMCEIIVEILVLFLYSHFLKNINIKLISNRTKFYCLLTYTMNQVFGSGLSGNPFDFQEYIKSPSVILRFISLIFSIIVFGCISNGGFDKDTCLFNDDRNACNYGTVIGVIAFLGCIAFLIGDALFPQFSNVDHRKYYVIIDMAFSALWSFLWFVGFCYLTNRLSNYDNKKNNSLNDPRGAIAFSFFSIISWALQCYFAVRKYQSGVGDLFASSDDVLDQQPYGGSNIPDSTGSRSASVYNDEQMIGGDLSGGYQQQHY